MSERIEKWDGSYTTMTKSVPTTKEVYVPSYPRLYFHPDSETLLALDQDDAHALEQESNMLNMLLAARMDALQRIEELTNTCTTLRWSQHLERDQHQYLLRKEYQHLDEACGMLRTALSALTPATSLPNGALVDEDSEKNAIGIMELIEIRGGKRGVKYIYVRSDKIKHHWRRYPLNSSEQNGDGKRFLKTVAYTAEDGQTHTRQAIDPEQLISQLTKLKPSLKTWEATLLDRHSGVWGQWAQAFNDSLPHSPNPVSRMAFDAQAQLLRWVYGAGVKCLINPFEIDIRTGKRKAVAELSGKTSAYANLALAAATSSAKLYLPDRSGVKICYPLDPAKIPGGGTGILGTLRFDLELTLAGSIGASLGIEASVSIATDRARGLPVKAVPGDIPGFWREVDVTKPENEIIPGSELSVFAGAETSANVSGTLMWLNPDDETTDNYNILTKVAVGAAAQAGVGVSGQLKFSWLNGKVRIEVSGGLCWGTGGKGSISFDVDGPAIMNDFMPCLVYMLRNADYIQLMKLMTSEDYYRFCAIPLLAGMYSINRVIDAGEKITDALRQSWESKEARVRLMENILHTAGDCLKFAPPESKGAAIASLIETNIWDELASPASHSETPCEGGTAFSARKRAIINTLRWVQSRREYENIMQHLSKIPGEGKGDWQAGEQRVIAFLAKGETPRSWGYAGSLLPGAQNITIKPGHYAENLQALYRYLPQAPNIPPGHIYMSTLPLREILPSYLYSCTQLITTMHGKPP